MVSRPEFDALTRCNFSLFVQRVFGEVTGGKRFNDNWHLHLIAAELEQVRLRQTQFLAIAQPPRSLKSIMASVALPAWILGHDPSAKIMNVSYGQKLTDDFAQMTRTVMNATWYKQLFTGTRLLPNRQAVDDFHTTAGGRRFATSIGGPATGFGADYMIIDDPTKPSEAASEAERVRANTWVRQTLMSRFNDQTKASIVLVMQRLHECDLIGDMQSYLQLKVVNLPAIAQQDEYHVFATPFGTVRHRRGAGELLHPEREPIEVVERHRLALGEYHFSAQYLQMPAPPGGGIVKPEWFQRFDLASPPNFDRIVQSWDTASTAKELSDYSVCTTWGLSGNRAYLLSVVRLRAEFPDLLRLVKQQQQLWRPKVILIEDSSSGTQLIQQLQYEGVTNVIPRKPLRDKVMRMRNQTAAIEGNLVFVPTAASWLDALLDELAMFPAGAHDDQVDSVSQALEYIYSHDPVRALMQAYDRPGDSPNVTLVRLNAPPGDFLDLEGRKVDREVDGSFLVDEQQARIFLQVPGVFRPEA